MEKWSNWSGSLKFTPGEMLTPMDEEALVDIVHRAASEKHTVRVSGAGHSSSPLVQTVAGAIGTGTHGTGERLQNLSGMPIGGRMVSGKGELVDFSIDENPDFLQSARVALGTLGIFTALRLRVQPAFKLHRREWCTNVDGCINNLHYLIGKNRNFDFYWYPRSDEIKLRTMNEPEDDIGELDFAKCVQDTTDWSAIVLPKTRMLKFDEMEYSLPAEAGPECFLEVRRRIKDKHRKHVGWRLLYRTVAKDDVYLSSAYGRETVTISLHHNAGLPFWDYFKDVEPIFRAYDGRPHWGKKHTLDASDLRKLYPMWEKFLTVRQSMDPEGVFLSPYMHELLGV